MRTGNVTVGVVSVVVIGGSPSWLRNIGHACCIFYFSVRWNSIYLYLERNSDDFAGLTVPTEMPEIGLTPVEG